MPIGNTTNQVDNVHKRSTLDQMDDDLTWFWNQEFHGQLVKYDACGMYHKASKALCPKTWSPFIYEENKY